MLFLSSKKEIVGGVEDDGKEGEEIQPWSNFAFKASCQGSPLSSHLQQRKSKGAPARLLRRVASVIRPQHQSLGISGRAMPLLSPGHLSKSVTGSQSSRFLVKMGRAQAPPALMTRIPTYEQLDWEQNKTKAARTQGTN